MPAITDLEAVFREALQLGPDTDVRALEYNTIKEWDSLAHMTLVAAIESRFDLMMDTDDVLDLSSFKQAVEILKKYDVQLAA